jgi:hypothetical protein
VTELFWDELLPSGPDDRDWSDVVRRAMRARRRRRASTLVAVVTSFGLVIAAAYALGHPIVDFKTAPKGPHAVVNDFGSLKVGAPPGMALGGLLPEEARRITSVLIDGKRHVLWIAPTKQGGYCDHWSGLIAECRANPRVVKRILFSRLYSARQGERERLAVGGSFVQSTATRLELVYQDGTVAEMPFVWVTDPIEAGFYLFQVPRAHWAKGHGPSGVRLYDEDDHLLASESTPYEGAHPDSNLNLHRLPGFSPLIVPTGAIWSKRRQLFDLYADDGAHIGLWVAPSSSGGTCFWSNQTAACPPPDREKHPRALQLGFSGGAHVTICCNVRPDVNRVVGRFEDGDRVELIPRENYLVWPIPSRHYPPGHRLVELVAFDAAGRRLGTERAPNGPGQYPCKKPKKLGYGVSMCP